jgi:GNAT superfamily N-acetyltransferase
MKDGDIQLRVATEADAEFIYRAVETTMRGYVEKIWGSFSEEYNRKQIADTIQKANYSIVQYRGEKIGALSVERHPTHIQLEQIYVLPSHQNRGIGTYLIRELVREAKAIQKPLRLRVLTVNPARKLYEREGFRVMSATPERFFMELCA